MNFNEKNKSNCLGPNKTEVTKIDKNSTIAFQQLMTISCFSSIVPQALRTLP